MVKSCQDCPRSWQDYDNILVVLAKILSQSYGGILARSSWDLDKTFQDHGKIMIGYWQDFDKILARSWWNLGKIVQDHGKIMIESWQDCDKILARIMEGFWQDHGGILTRSSKTMAIIDYNRILARF